MASLMNPPGAGYGASTADDIRRRLAGAPKEKVQNGLSRIAGQNASLNKSLGITTDAAGNQVTPPPAATTKPPGGTTYVELGAMQSPAAGPVQPDSNPMSMNYTDPSAATALAPPPQLPTTSELPQATAARPPLPPIGRGMNGERALSETSFGTGMNGTPNPIGAATQRTRRATPSAPRDPAAFIEENLANARVKLSGIGNPKGNGAIRNRGPRGARFGDTVKGGRFSGQKLEDVKSRLMGEYANQ